MQEKLLGRDGFNEAVFERDHHKCVICGDTESPLDAHHIIERRLWPDGGYYVSNGATLCDKGTEGCHYKAETTEISVEDLRIACNIQKPIIPPDMYSDQVYDKWGNIILPNGTRTKGPLFDDESVQKVISRYLNEFTDYVKYPRTHHLPWSPGITDDDRVMDDLSTFEGKRVVVTRKMDGENFSGYRDYCHARSVDSRHHYTRDWVKNYWMQRSYELPEGWRVCAENLYAVHSIAYDDLPSYLMGFSIWNEKNMCLSWDETVEWFELLEMDMVPVLYDGIFDVDVIKRLHNPSMDSTSEGYVVRLADSFHYRDFKHVVAKYVRANHVATQKHWFYGRNDHEVNKLREK